MKWGVRTISTYVAATTQAENVNEIIESAQRIGEDDRSAEEREAQQQSVVDPPNGSFERFMGSFGNPQRWAGR